MTNGIRILSPRRIPVSSLQGRRTVVFARISVLASAVGAHATRGVGALGDGR